MNGSDELRQTVIETLKTEAEALARMSTLIDDTFIQIIERIHNSGGRVILTGIGKSAQVAQKISATLNSTGTPAIFMHAADAIHGDLGTIQEKDVIVCLSKSGNTPEIKVLIPLIKGLGNLIVGMVAEPGSFLALHADLVIITPVEKEACPFNLTPTTSTTLQMAVGDALAMALLQLKGFKTEDFARLHPGGALGKRLYLRVADLFPQNERPLVAESTPVHEVILEISSKRLGATAVVDAFQQVTGIITDGDLRRMMEHHRHFEELMARDIMAASPKTIAPEEPVVRALEIMRTHSITQLLVIQNATYLGIIHIHDILREGIV